MTFLICTFLFFDINQLKFWLGFPSHFATKYFPIKCFGNFIPDKSMCKSYSKMFLSFKIGQEMTEQLRYKKPGTKPAS